MGVDIHMSIVKNGEYVDKEIFEGRNSEWFDNLQNRGWDDVYDTLPVEHGIYDGVPEDVKEDYNDNNTYFSFRYIKVKDMFDWLREMEPWIDAGWASSYQRWNYRIRNIIPEDGFPHYKPDDTNEPYYFIEYEKKYEPSKWLYKYIRDKYDEQYKDEFKNIPEDEYLIYYFDC